MRRCDEEMRDLIVRERKDKAKLQREIEHLTQQVADSETIRRQEVLSAQNEAERVSRECRVAQEERRLIQQRMSEMQAEQEDMKRRVEGKSTESEVIERELRKLQERHREAMAQVH